MIAAPRKSSVPYVEYCPGQGGPVRRVLLTSLPFRIGRGIASDFAIHSHEVSKNHAEIFGRDSSFHVRDLGSTNGTFVNGKRVAEARLANDDILHIAHEEFRFVHPANGQPGGGDDPETHIVRSPVPTSVIRGSKHLLEMVLQRRVRIVFQPIVCLETRRPVGYEALARGTHDGLSAKPAELLCLADRCGMTRSLSRMFRQAAVEEAARLPGGPPVFFNLHPSEMGGQPLRESLGELRAAVSQGLRVVLEVHENAVTDVDALRRLRGQCRELGIRVAYDDFGAGQARFLELAEVPPDFIKLDMRLVRDIHLADSRQNLIRALNQAGTELGVKTIAEGIETPEEEEVCRSLGCHFGQGFLFGAPQAAALLSGTPPDAEPAHVVLS